MEDLGGGASPSSPQAALPSDHIAPPPGPRAPRGLGVARERMWAVTLGAGLLAGVGAWLAGEVGHKAFRPKVETMMTAVGPMVGSTSIEHDKADTRNASLAFALEGAFLGLVLGLAGGVLRRSPRASGVAGLAGFVLGGLAGLGASLALQPVYYGGLRLDQIEQDLVTPLLVHAGIGAAVGAMGGIAFGLGLGGGRNLIARAVAGGLIGGIFAACAYEMVGAFALPDAEMTRPLSLTWVSRLLARVLVGLFVAGGIVALVLHKRPINLAATSAN